VARGTNPDIRAALRGELERCLTMLAQPSLSDDAIHDLRQALKRARAALRLLQDAVSHAAYARENGRLRDAARPLSAARDARVMLGLVDELIRARKTRPYRRALLRVREQLRKTHERRLAVARGKRSLATVRNRVEHCLQSTSRWRLPHDARRIYAGGLSRIYEQGRGELQAALVRRSTRALHEWRKQVKYLDTAIALLAAREPRFAKAHKSAAKVAKFLGADHDLAMLSALLRRMRAERRLVEGLERQRSALQKRALERGERLYKHAPERFVADLT
jgi:hypothetical protein